ncbi:MAG: hypothetical protein MK076_02195 [Flavobacteriales bacterium]|nr:hypothetical protein [Flavobacteriales bacterium]
MTTKIPSRPKDAKGQPPKKVEAKSNLTKPEPEEYVNMSFKMTAEFKRNFKIAAAVQGISQSELLRQTFAVWQRENG